MEENCYGHILNRIIRITEIITVPTRDLSIAVRFVAIIMRRGVCKSRTVEIVSCPVLVDRAGPIFAYIADGADMAEVAADFRVGFRIRRRPKVSLRSVGFTTPIRCHDKISIKRTL